MSQEPSPATNGEGVSWSRLPVMTGMTFGSDCIVNGVEVKAGTVIKFETPGAHRADLADLLWTLYEGLYGHRKAQDIDPFKTAVGGALEVKKAWDARGASAVSETPRSEPTAWAIFASDTHEMIDLSLIKPDEAPGQYVEPLFARSATPRSATTDLGKLVEGWQAEEDAVNRDAARYRWLRDAPTGDQLNDITDAYWESPEDFDETVDKAMKEAE